MIVETDLNDVEIHILDKFQYFVKDMWNITLSFSSNNNKISVVPFTNTSFILNDRYEFPFQMRSLMSTTWNSKNIVFQLAFATKWHNVWQNDYVVETQCKTRKMFVDFIAFLYREVTGVSLYAFQP